MIANDFVFAKDFCTYTITTLRQDKTGVGGVGDRFRLGSMG
jgi:hypothetical protein